MVLELLTGGNAMMEEVRRLRRCGTEDATGGNEGCDDGGGEEHD